MKVFVTGLGIISCLGYGIKKTKKMLENQKTGISQIEYLNTNHSVLGGEIKKTNLELLKLCELKNKIKRYSRTSLLGLLAAKECVKNVMEFNGYKTGFISATTVGGMGNTEQTYNKYLTNKQVDLNSILTHDCAESTEFIAEQLGVKDYVTTINTACSSSANSILLGTRLIKNKILDRVIVGGVDSLTKFTINGFKSLMIYDNEICKPFDKNRGGLNLGEGAAYLLLESENIADENNILAEIKGYSNTCDAYHQTATSPEGEGIYSAMKKSINQANLKLEDIDYINAHGTGTKNNDLSEGRAIERLFKKNKLYISSTKGYTGHTLGASGSIEAVISIISLKNKMIFPNLNLLNEIEKLSFKLVRKVTRNIKLNNIITNSCGFGGNDTSILISRCN